MRVLAFVAVVLAAVSAGPTPSTPGQASRCAGYCKDSRKYKYEVGTSYVYKYTADTVTSVNGAGREESALHFSADVDLHAVSPCDFIMKLHNVNLSDSSPDEMAHLSEFTSAMERNPLTFSFHDGRVDDLCVTNIDAPWVLNIKRGVLSAFQNSMKDLHTSHRLFETDVTGDCETEYSVRSADHNYSIVDKRKNLLTCAHRLDHFLSLQSTPYMSQSATRSLPLVKSDHHCVQTFEKGLLTQAVCKESHLFQPFSNGENGALTRVVQNLEYVHHSMEKQPAKTGEVKRRATLLFEHTVDSEGGEARAQTIMKTLEELQRTTRHGVEHEVPKLFAQLLTMLKSTSYPTLAKVFSHTKHQHTRKFLLDAMPLVGTADGLTVMVDLYKSSEITDAEMDAWLTSLTFLKRPTITMLLAVSSLLDGNPRPKAILGLSALVHSYCQTDSDCHEKAPVQNYLSRLEKLLGNGCHVKGRHDMEMKILALKGIGNMGVLPTSLNTISQCYMNPENPLEVQLAAIGAHRRLPCTDSWVSNLLQIYSNMKLDTEIRIASYLAVMQCPSSVILARVKETLYNEEVNQVGSFVWTHLTNIQETTNRWKQNIKDLLSSDFLQKKFQTDVRKFSRNYEGSIFFDSLNVGVAVDSNIVFTPQSYLPRSASLNLTLDIFGESINVFEIGSRAEGFELIVEDMFGPGGYFPDKSLKKVLQNARGKQEDNDLENSIDKLGKIFNKQSKLVVEPQASVYARVFGNEIHYSRYQGLDELVNGEFHGSNPFDVFSRMFGSGKDIDYINSFVFLDASYRFPTAVGLPLELSVNGSATIGLKVSGQLDLSISPIKVIGKVAPSAAVQVVGTMAVDGVLTKAGLRSVSTLHSNTYLQGHATIRGKNLIDIKLDVPREKMEILEVTSKMYVLRQEGFQEMKGILENREEYSSCSSDIVSSITGMKLCTDLVYPNASYNATAPYFPLTGPTTLQLTLMKTDSFKSYELNFQQLVQADGDIRTMKFHFDTPNSQVDRKILASFILDSKNVAVKGNLETPFIKLDASGKLDYSESSKALDLSLNMNDKNLFSTKAVVKTSYKGHLNRYEPTLSVAIHDLVDMRLTGKVNYIEDTKYSADFEVAGLTKTPLLFSADLSCGDNKYDMVGSVQSPMVDGTIHANIRQTNSFVNSKVTVEYSFQQAKTETVNLFFKIQSGYKRGIQKNSLLGSLQMSAMSQYNLLVHLDRMTGENYAEYTGRFGLGKTEWNTKQMYRFHARGRENIDFVLLSHLACPSKNVDYKLSLAYKKTEFSLSTHVLAQLNSQHKFYSSLDYQHLDEQQDFSVEFSTPWRIVSLRGGMTEKEPGHFNTRVTGQYEVLSPQEVSTIHSLTMHSIYIDESTDTQQNLQLSVNLTGLLTASLTGELVSGDSYRNGWAHLDLLDNKYRTSITYNMDSEGQHVVDTSVLLLNRVYKSQMIVLNTDKKTEFSLDLDLSKRLFLSSKKLNEGIIQGVEFELLWDKNVDPSKRIAFVAHTNNVKREALLQFPGQYIKAELITLPKRISGLLEWTEKQKISMNMEWNIEQSGFSGTAKLTTPFSGLLSQGVVISYNRNFTVTQIQTELTWQDERISLNAAGLYGKRISRVNDKPGETVYEAEAEVTSTIQHIHDLTAKYKHVTSRQTLSKSLIILSNKKTIFNSNWTSGTSDLKADLYFDSPCKLLPSLHGNLSSMNSVKQGIHHNVQLSIDLDKTFIMKYSSQVNGTSGVIQLVTPFDRFRNTSVYFDYTNNGAEMNLVSGVDHNEKVSTLSLFGSRSERLIVGSSILTLPLTDVFEAGFTHSLEKGSLVEGVSLSFGGKQVLLGSLVGNYHSWKDFKLSVDITSPPHSLITKVENQFGSEGIKTEVDGMWNGDHMSTSLLIVDSEMHLIALASKLQKDKEFRFELSHKRKPNMHYVTNLQLHNYLNMKHDLIVEDISNWQSIVYLKTSSSEGHLTNKQSYGGLDFKHSLVVEWNGPVIDANAAFTLYGSGLVKSAEGTVTTPWSFPLTFTFNFPTTSTTVNPQLKLKYQKDKEITVVSFIQYEIQASRFQFEIKSPNYKPFSINALYDVSLPTKAALLSVEWDEIQVDFKATVHMENKKCVGVVVLTRTDIDDEYFNAQFKYDLTQLDDMTSYLTVTFKDKKVGVALSGSISDQVWKGDSEITTSFISWEKLFLSVSVYPIAPLKRCVITVGRNNQMASLISSFQRVRPLMLNAELTSTMNSLPNISLSSVLEIEEGHRSMQVLLSSGGHDIKLAATLHTDKEFNFVEVSVISPIRHIEDLFGRASYVNKPSNSSLDIQLKKNQSKVQVQANSLWMGNDTGEVSVSFLSPFEGLEKLTGKLKHTLKMEPHKQLITDITLKHNSEQVDIVSSFAASRDNLIINVQCKTPHDDFKTLIGDLAIKHTPTQKSIDVSLAKNSEYVKTSAVLNMKGPWNVKGDFQVITPFEGYKGLSAGFDYDWQNYLRYDEMARIVEGKAKLFLNTPDYDNTVAINLDYVPSLQKTIINASLELPVLTTLDINVEGFLDIQQQAVLIQGKVNDQFLNLHGELTENSLNASVVTSVNGFEKLNFTSVFSLTPERKDAKVLLTKDNVEYLISASIVLSPLTSEIHIEGKTPINQWENFNLNAKYDVSNEKKNAMFSYERLDQYTIAAEWSRVEGEIAEYNILFSSPIPGYRSVLISTEYNLDHVFSGKALIHMEEYKVEGVVLITDKDMKLILETPAMQSKHLALIASYGFDSTRKFINVQLERNEDKFKFDNKLVTTSDTSELLIITPFKQCQQLSVLVTHKGIPNKNNNKMFGISINKDSDKLVDISGELELQLDSRIGFNLNATLPVLSSEKISAEAWYIIRDSKRKVIVNLRRNDANLAELEGSILLLHEKEVDYLMKMAGSFLESDRHAVEFQVQSNENLSKLVFSLVNYNTEDKYAIRILFSNTSFELGLSSPIKGYEDFSLRLLHDSDRLGIDFNSSFFYYDTLQLSSQLSSQRRYNNFFILSLGKGVEKLAIVSSLQYDTLYMKSSFVLDSQFSKYNFVNLTFGYDLSNRLMTGMFGFEGYNYKMEVDGRFSVPSLVSIESYMNIKTSFPNIKNVKLHGSLELEKTSNKSCAFFLNFNDDLQVDAEISLGNNFSRGILAATAAAGYNGTSTSVGVSYDFIDPSKHMSFEGFFRGFDLVLNAKSVIRDYLKHGELHAIYQCCKNEIVFDRKLMWDMKNDSTQKSAKLMLDLGEKKKFEASATVDIATLKTVKSVFNFTDFVTSHYALTAGWNVADKQVTSDVILQWNQQKVAMAFILENTNMEYASNIKLISPFKDFEEIFLQYKCSHGKIKKITSLLQWKKDKKIILNVLYPYPQFQVTFETPYTSLFNFTLSHELSRISKLDLRTEMLASLHYGSWKNDLVILYDVGKDTKLTVTLLTPIYNIQSLQIDGSFKTKEWKSEAVLALLIKNMKWQFSGTVEEHNKKFGLNVTWLSPLKWLTYGEILASYSHADGHEALFSIKHNETFIISSSAKLMPSHVLFNMETLWSGIQLVHIEGRVIVNGQHSQLFVTAIFEDKKSELIASVNAASDKQLVAEVDLKTPWSKDIAVHSVYNRDESHTLKVSVRMGDRVTEMLGTGKYKVAGMSMEMAMECMVDGHGILSGKAGYNWQNPQKTAFVNVRLGETVFDIQAQGKASREGIMGDLIINTPIESLKLFELRVELEKTGSIVMNVNERKYELHYSTVFASGLFSAQMSITSPLYEIENVQFSVRYGKNILSFAGEIEGDRYEFLNSFYFETSNYSLNSELRVPVKLLNHIEFKYNLDMKRSVFSSLLQWGDAEMIIIDSKLNADDFHVAIKTPFENIYSVEVKSQFVAKENQYSLLGSADWDGLKLAVDVSVQQEPLDVNVNVQTVWKNNQTAMLMSNLSNKKEKLTLSTTGIVKEKTVTFVGEIDKVNLAGKLQVQTPVLDAPIYIETHLCKDLWKSCEIDVQVTLHKVISKLTINYLLTDRDVKMGLDVNLPFVKMNVDMGGSYFNNNTDIETFIYINNNRLSVSYEITNRVFIGSVDIIAPDFGISVKRVDFQTSLAFNPDIQASLTYRSSTYNGSIAGSLSKSSDSFSLQTDLDLPQTLGPKTNTLRFGVKYYGRQRFIEFRLDNGRYTRSGVLEINTSASNIVIAGRVTSPTVGEKVVTIMLLNNWHLLSANFFNTLHFEVKHDSNSGSALVSYRGQGHKLFYNSIRTMQVFSASVGLESVLLKSGNINLEVLSEVHDKNIKAVARCVVGALRNEVVMHFINRHESKSLVLNIVRTSEAIVKIELSNQLEGHFIENKASLELANSSHGISFRYRPSWPINMQITALSPLIPNSLLTVEFKLDNSSLVAFAGIGDEALNQSIALKAGLNVNERTVNFEFQAPLCDIKTVSFGSIFKISRQNVHFVVEGLYSSTAYSDVKFTTIVIASESGVNTLIHFRSPFDDLKHFTAAIQVPFKFNNHYDMKLLLILPSDAKYELYGHMQNINDALELAGGIEYRGQKINGSFKFSKYPVFSITSELNTPYKRYRHYKIHLQGQHDLISGDDVINFVEWGDQRIELRHTTVSTGSKHDYRIQLSTPFRGFERYVVGFQLEIGVSKKALIMLSLPNMEKDWMVEFDFHLNAITDTRFLVNVEIPILTGFRSASLLVGSKYDMDTVSYRGIISGNYNKYEFLTALDSVVEGKGLKLDFKTQLNEDKISAQFLGGLQEAGAVIGSLDIETPFARLRNGKFSLKMFNRLQKLQIGAIWNSKDIINISIFESEDKKTTIEIRNPWKSVSATYSLHFGKDTDVSGLLCWDLNKKATSVFGVGVQVNNGPQNRQHISLNLKLPTREMSLSHTYHHTMSMFEHSTMFSWELEKAIGYRILLENDPNIKQNALLRMDLPFRAFELNSYTDYVVGHTGAQFLWNAAVDRSKKMGASLLWTPYNAKVLLQHSGMKHDVILRLEQDNCFSRDPEYPSTFKLSLQYSPELHDLFNMEIFFKGSTEKHQGLETYLSFQHDASNLDHGILLNTLHNSEISTTRLGAHYKKFLTGEKETLELYYKLRKNISDIEIYIQDTNNKIAVKGSVQTKKNGYDGLVLQLSMNQKEPLRIEGRISKQEMSSELDISYGTNRGYTISAGMPTPRLFSAGITRKIHSLPSTDAQITFKLNTSRLLWTQIKWNRGMLEKMQLSLLKEYSDIVLVTQSIVNSFSEVFEQEPTEQMMSLFSAVYTDSFAGLRNYTLDELHLIAYDFAASVEAAVFMYEQNDFYIRDIHQSLVKFSSYIQEKGAGILKQLLQMSKDFYMVVKRFYNVTYKTLCDEFTKLHIVVRKVHELLTTAYQHVAKVFMDVKQLSKQVKMISKKLLMAVNEGIVQAEQTTKRMRVAVNEYTNIMLVKCSDSLEPVAVTIQHYIIVLHHSVVAIKHSIIDMAQTVVDTIMSIKELRELIALYNEYYTWLEGIQLQQYIENVFQYFNVVGEILMEDFHRMFAEYKVSVNSALNAVSNQVDRLDQAPAVVYIKCTVSTVYDKVLWVWTYFDMSTHLELYTKRILSNFDEIVAQLLHNIDMGPQPRSYSKHNLVVQPGLLEVTHHLPVDWDSFQEWPQFSQLTDSYFSHTAEDKSYEDYIISALNKLVPNLSKDILLPPFDATGIIAGKKHFITFDNYFYDFVGECSYLLASDFISNKFSVVVNYEFMDNSAVKKSLTVISSEQHIHISANYQVSVNGREVELPVIVGDGIVISRFGNNLIVEVESYVSVECNLVHDICTIQLSGWNYGKTAGLLGTFDNEPSSDISFPNRTSTSDLARFASSWQIGNKSLCQPVNHAVSAPVNDDAIDACDAYLTDMDSPLADCYSVIDPLPYYHMCISDMVQATDAKGICTAAVAYTSVCRKSGVEISLPEECIQCRLPNNPTLSVGESKVVNSSMLMSADVVFVVEQSSCLKDVNLAKLASKLESALVQQGLTNNRFSVVGFGGNLFSRPHSRTAKGKIWTSVQSIENAFASLVFSDDIDSKDEQTVYEALTFASHMTFRGGVSKTVVLVQCTACSVKLDYSSMMGLLLQNDITLHLLEPGAVALQAGSQKTKSKVLGADLSGVYVARNARSAKPNSDLFKEMILPLDHCSPLAFETNGTVFNLDKAFASAKQAGLSKKFIDVWSRRVAQGSQPSPCQKCQCVANEDGSGQVRCSKCVTASVEQYLLDWQSLFTEDYVQDEAITSTEIEEV